MKPLGEDTKKWLFGIGIPIAISIIFFTASTLLNSQTDTVLSRRDIEQLKGDVAAMRVELNQINSTRYTKSDAAPILVEIKYLKENLARIENMIIRERK